MCVLNTSLGEKSIVSLVKLRRQLTDFSGSSFAIAAIWIGEQVPGGKTGLKLKHTFYLSK